ncbi:PilZ domain-containing protein [Desulfobulbus oligotrophicus]|jgi:c-di-GMP-binding flagellar brake protein YcgR|uniref:PilZ domain-containing protein n=1 Tax=Desulfobulbus oligotrophicus TaxID=1909699 RepID=A0A7T5VBF6_9BACT|nr:PilZ domain-containing protein [Desulfobulbus oligotrophicus]MDY0390507.1 PilZ domain-containing protein [Desulfobulbus oligotrophicus]QQG64798.1 PilZ domain-containing protein [Desulfobulbus oligotrophicus]
MTTERRKYIRPESLHLLDYLIIDAQGRLGEYAMARTLNVSKGGMLIETHIPLAKGQQVMITLGLHEQLVDVMGTVIYTTDKTGLHYSGVEFLHVSDHDKQVLDSYITAFQQQYPADTTPYPMEKD